MLKLKIVGDLCVNIQYILCVWFLVYVISILEFLGMIIIGLGQLDWLASDLFIALAYDS